jgi:hypothetical protein
MRGMEISAFAYSARCAKSCLTSEIIGQNEKNVTICCIQTRRD